MGLPKNGNIIFSEQPKRDKKGLFFQGRAVGGGGYRICSTTTSATVRFQIFNAFQICGAAVADAPPSTPAIYGTFTLPLGELSVTPQLCPPARTASKQPLRPQTICSMWVHSHAGMPLWGESCFTPLMNALNVAKTSSLRPFSLPPRQNKIKAFSHAVMMQPLSTLSRAHLPRAQGDSRRRLRWTHTRSCTYSHTYTSMLQQIEQIERVRVVEREGSIFLPFLPLVLHPALFSFPSRVHTVSEEGIHS